MSSKAEFIPDQYALAEHGVIEASRVVAGK